MTDATDTSTFDGPIRFVWLGNVLLVGGPSADSTLPWGDCNRGPIPEPRRNRRERRTEASRARRIAR